MHQFKRQQVDINGLGGKDYKIQAKAPNLVVA
jgi:hypothetical protein